MSMKNLYEFHLPYMVLGPYITALSSVPYSCLLHLIIIMGFNWQASENPSTIIRDRSNQIKKRTLRE
ncbi:uncharacterized protein K441DRAFT_656536 [Cenococcum geophilum 1.58]|uniref:uncharacterized protein n=1 Tax=Cenococcum geophilum 1.58 TaxID=794803 RepID=UPI00358E2653|nr:hypothetical protein K441DRAFT_656536 [Cenococcum geophilum 1.58]